MRLNLAWLLALFVASLAYAQDTTQPPMGTPAYLDWRYGFRDLKFEQPLEACKDMYVSDDRGDVKFCKRKDENLRLGEAVLSEIVYVFHKGRFLSVQIDAKEQSNSRALLAVLEEAYGPGSVKPKEDPNNHRDWMGKRVLGTYTLYASGIAVASYPAFRS